MTDINSITTQFLTQYYNTLMSSKQSLIKFYADVSSMTYGGTFYSSGQSYKGLKQIKQKLESLGYNKIQFQLHDKDIQMGPGNSFLIFVTGELMMDDENNFKFAQTFLICSNNTGGLYVHNDIFRLII